MIIFDEYKFAEGLVKDRNTMCSVKNLLAIARYNKSIGKDLNFIASDLYYRLGNKNLNRVDYVLDHYLDRSLRTPESVRVYKKELELIRSQPIYAYQKILFIFVCICRMIRGDSSNSLSIKSGTEFTVNKLCKVAKVNFTKKQQILFLKFLNDNELATMDNVWNLKLTFMDNNDGVGLEIKCSDNMVYWYDKYIGKKVIVCEKCGEPVKVDNVKITSKKYCEKCAKEVKNQQNMEYYYNNKKLS